ncbi:hypothetical protein BT93_L0437 [Corymbia citriodora subsp. variegata]|uniref:Uncharacterized protein n=1 Tax=Corymbia citriodora subsp. variegata TaxID=360336 RepID=A0A8T0CJ30_CORYI|nr:hypothetical protein BT93_L0437 [Corymbia citriodora subsp. variegata]
MMHRSFIARRAFVSTPFRSFQSARVLAVGKESALHEEGRAEEVDKVKNEQIQKQKEGKGHWHEELSSDSESIVKADRGEINASNDTIAQLQEESKKVLSQKK